MQKWEYLILVMDRSVRHNPRIYTVNGQRPRQELNLQDYLPELGKQGWELSAIDGDIYYFKRAIE